MLLSDKSACAETPYPSTIPHFPHTIFSKVPLQSSLAMFQYHLIMFTYFSIFSKSVSVMRRILLHNDYYHARLHWSPLRGSYFNSLSLPYLGFPLLNHLSIRSLLEFTLLPVGMAFLSSASQAWCLCRLAGAEAPAARPRPHHHHWAKRERSPPMPMR